MRVVALEEHFSVPSVARRIAQDVISRRGFRPRKITPGAPNPMELLPEIGEGRLKSMDETGVTVQVLSVAGPGADLVPGPDGLAMAREVNDHLAAAIARHPDRFAGFANLPMQSPDAIPAELKRAVKELGLDVYKRQHDECARRQSGHIELRVAAADDLADHLYEPRRHHGTVCERQADAHRGDHRHGHRARSQCRFDCAEFDVARIERGEIRERWFGRKGRSRVSLPSTRAAVLDR